MKRKANTVFYTSADLRANVLKTVYYLCKYKVSLEDLHTKEWFSKQTKTVLHLWLMDAKRRNLVAETIENGISVFTATAEGKKAIQKIEEQQQASTSVERGANPVCI